MSATPNGNSVGNANQQGAAKRQVPPAPYKGLVPYTAEDSALFFGRDAERSIIVANLRSSRFTLLYGPSGVGKSSVVGAGVVHYLRERAKQNLAKRGTPEFAIVYFNQWRDEPVLSLERAVRAEVEGLLGKSFDDGPDFSKKSLDEQLSTWAERAGGDLLIILDQFEDLFLYHPNDSGPGSFTEEFPKVVTDKQTRVNFIISIREDAVAKLDIFEGQIPTLFDNYIRIDHLSRDAARDAIVKPIEQYNKTVTDPSMKVNIEPALVDAVLDEVKAGRVSITETGAGRVKDSDGEDGESSDEDDDAARIETPFLQLVMTRLWDEDVTPNSPRPFTLKLDTLKRLGGAERIVRTHLDKTMGSLPSSERAAAAGMFHYLVTPSGTKIAHTARDLAEYTGSTEAKLTPVLEKMSASGIRILRPVAPPPDRLNAPTRYEIFHDVLAPAMLDWRRRYLQQRRNRLIYAGAAAAVLFIVVIVGLLLYNLRQSQQQLAQKAQEAQNLSEAILTSQPTDVAGATAAPVVVALKATAAAVGTSSAAISCQGSPSVNFTANPTTSAPGKSITLEWGQSLYVNTVQIDQGIGKVSFEGSQQVQPLQTTTYTLTAEGCGGAKTTRTITITIVEPTATATSVVPTASPLPPTPTNVPPTATRIPPTRPAATATTLAPTATVLTAPPGVYVTQLTTNPANPTGGQDVTFQTDFLNTTGSDQTYKWCVYVFSPDQFPAKHLGQTSCVQVGIPQGASSQAAVWKSGVVGGCTTYIAQAVFLESNNVSNNFLKPGNADSWLSFQVC